MASGYRCVALRAFAPSRTARICTRSFSSHYHLAEEQAATNTSPRARAQRESADAVQRLAQSRQASTGGVAMRRITLTPQSGDTSPDAPLPSSSRPRDDRRPSFSRASNDSSSFRQTSGSRSRGPPRPFRGSGGANVRGNRPAQANSGENDNNNSRSQREHFSLEDQNPELDSGGDAMTTAEHDAYLKKLGLIEKKVDTTFPGPRLDMASLLLEYAPRNIGATEPVTGQYPDLVDQRSRGLLQHIITQARKNETYTEADIEKLTKKLGPTMPRA